LNTEENRFIPLNNLLVEGVARGVYTAAVALVGLKGELVWEGAVGRVSLEPDAEPVTPMTIFDLASLTKPLVTALCVLCLVREEKLALDATLGEVLPVDWLPEDKKPLTIESLLTHRSGLPAWRPFFDQLLKAPRVQRRQLLPRLAATEPLEHPPDTVTLYSDLGFMLLAAVVEAISGLTLDRFCRECIYQPLGLISLGYIKLGHGEGKGRGRDNLAPQENTTSSSTEAAAFSPSPLRGEGRGGGDDNSKNRERYSQYSYAATETGLIPDRPGAGEVHDENAWAAGGVAGHSGLFGPGFEVFKLLSALHRAFHGETVKGLQPFPPELVRRFFTPVPGGRALGFDVPSPDKSQCSAGRFFSPHSVGHLGFTGTSFWLDLDLGQMVVLLTNRVHLGRNDKIKIAAFRPWFHEAASRGLGFTRAFRD
jgi:CubicO group peptidase (beta-lactamase class C family)